VIRETIVIFSCYFLSYYHKIFSVGLLFFSFFYITTLFCTAVLITFPAESERQQTRRPSQFLKLDHSFRYSSSKRYYAYYLSHLRFISYNFYYCITACLTEQKYFTATTTTFTFWKIKSSYLVRALFYLNLSKQECR